MKNLQNTQKYEKTDMHTKKKGVLKNSCKNDIF